MRIEADGADRTEFAGGAEPLDTAVRGHIALHWGDHQSDARLLRRLHHGTALRHAAGHGLLHQHVLAGAGGRDRRLSMKVVRQADIDGVDIVPRDGVLVVACRKRRSQGRRPPLGELAGAVSGGYVFGQAGMGGDSGWV